MSHVRTQIRLALTAVFESIDGLAGRVVSDPAEIRDADAGPWVELVIGAEQSQRITLLSQLGGARVQRQLQVLAGIHTRGYAPAVDERDRITLELEKAVFANRALGGLLASPLVQASIAPSEPDRTGSLPRQHALIEWRGAYCTTEADASAALSR